MNGVPSSGDQLSSRTLEPLIPLYAERCKEKYYLNLKGSSRFGLGHARLQPSSRPPLSLRAAIDQPQRAQRTQRTELGKGMAFTRQVAAGVCLTIWFSLCALCSLWLDCSFQVKVKGAINGAASQPDESLRSSGS